MKSHIQTSLDFCCLTMVFIVRIILSFDGVCMDVSVKEYSLTKLTGASAVCPDPVKKPNGTYCNKYGFTCKDGVSGIQFTSIVNSCIRTLLGLFRNCL